MASETTTIPTTSAALSFVPNSDTASSLREAANRSMNCVPTADTSDGPDSAIPQTSSPTPSATIAATTPATAPSAGRASRSCGWTVVRARHRSRDSGPRSPATNAMS